MRRLPILAAAAFCLISCTQQKRPEITWSLMHPTLLDTVYFQRVLSEMPGCTVDGFEICGGDARGAMDGLIKFEEYPLAAADQTRNVDHNIKSLNRIVELSHAAGKPVYYWHREVLCSKGMIEEMPDLLDEQGEFDLLGNAYENYLRYKIRKTFEAVPELDGLVLTLTEADYSTMHNSRTDIYPPVKVAEKLGRIFAEELKARGKRFIFRSFGCISKDYEDLIAGAAALAKDFSFEVETKITPYDFSPCLPDNPFLEKVEGCTLGAECDALGEFLGVGRMPAEGIEDIVRYVNYASTKGVDRYAIRLDRHGKCIFDAYPINLYAYEQAILRPGVTADQIRREYYGKLYPEDVAAEMVRLSENGIKCVKKTVFIDGSIIFHQFPSGLYLNYIKSGGILGIFPSRGDLHNTIHQWGMLHARSVPGRAAIIKEKEEAVALAEDGLKRVEKLAGRIPEQEYERLKSAWSYACDEALSIGEFCKVLCAYFDSFEERDAKGSKLKSALASMYETLGDRQYMRPIRELCALAAEEFDADLSWHLEGDKAIDAVFPGTISDQGRVEHYMHACKYPTTPEAPEAVVGNIVFPNGYVKMEMKGVGAPAELFLEGIGKAVATVNGEEAEVVLDGGTVLNLPAADSYTVSISKAPGKEYPTIRKVIVKRR